MNRSLTFGHRGQPVVFEDLQGAVNDVNEFEKLAEGLWPDIVVRKLVSPTPLDGSTYQPAKRDQLPTYDNIIKTIKDVTDTTTPGDIVHLHFSCHGIRGPRSYPLIKGLRPGSAMIPMDIHTNGKLIRDVDLHCYLREMTGKGAHVSIVCDCCYSGSLISDSVKRGTNSRDDTDDDGVDAINGTRVRVGNEFSAINVSGLRDVSLEQETLNRSAGSVKTHNPDKMGGQPSLKVEGFEIFASCRKNQRCNEIAMSGVPYGVYTWHLLKILAEKSRLTYGELQQRLSDTMRDVVPRQDPMFAGNSERYFLSSDVAEEE